MTEKYRKPLRLACEDAFLPHLRQVLEQNPPERHAGIKEQFAAHMDFLADFCLRGYPGAGGLTVEFIKGLHRAMFPPDYRQEVTTRDGHKIWMVPGEYKSISNNVGDSSLRPGEVNVFLAPEKVPAAMARIVGEFNAALQSSGDVQHRQDAILYFVLDFLDVIHPFVDGNGRVAFILADLLAIRAELPPFRIGKIKHHDDISLVRAMELRRASQSLDALYRLLSDYGWPGEQRVLPRVPVVSDEPPGLKTNMRLACEDAFRPYLRQALEQNPPGHHAEIERLFAEHMAFLADFCLRGYPGPGHLTVEFIKGLHRACFPPDFRQQRIRIDGSSYWLVPGEFKTVDHLRDYVADPFGGVAATFYPAVKVSSAMDEAVSRLNAILANAVDDECTYEAILIFVIFDFLLIHPFADANGRVGYMLAELLALRAGLAPFGFGKISIRNKSGLDNAIYRARQTQDLNLLYEILEAHGWRRPCH